MDDDLSIVDESETGCSAKTLLLRNLAICHGSTSAHFTTDHCNSGSDVGGLQGGQEGKRTLNGQWIELLFLWTVGPVHHVHRNEDEADPVVDVSIAHSVIPRSLRRSQHVPFHEENRNNSHQSNAVTDAGARKILHSYLVTSAFVASTICDLWKNCAGQSMSIYIVPALPDRVIKRLDKTRPRQCGTRNEKLWAIHLRAHQRLVCPVLWKLITCEPGEYATTDSQWVKGVITTEHVAQ